MATLKNTTVDTTGAIQLPVGTTAQRPTASAGHMRYNSTFKTVETYDGTRWRYMPDIVRNGLVLYLDAGEPASYPGSGTTWTDLSGNGNNGTLTNGPTYSSSNGGSIVFDGVNDFITTNNQLDPVAYGLFADATSFWSVSSWFSPDITNTSGGAITGKGGGTGGVATYVVWETGTTLSTRLRGGSILTISSSLESSSWYEVVITWDGTTAKAYLNGNFISDITVGTAAKQSNNFCVGATAGGLNTFYKGNIADTKVYNRALTPQEIQQNYLALKGRFS